MATLTDEPINLDTMAAIRGCAAEALDVLGKEYASADPIRMMEAVDEFAYRWQKGIRPSTELVEDLEQARLIFGSLWGEQLVKQFGWTWANVIFGDGSSAYGAVSPDRSLAVYPLHFMLGCLQDPGVDVTVMLSFNMLLAGSIPSLPPNSYNNLMDGVHRIVPRE